ncbi:MAG: quinone-dependent dihydroorotate dehydrogenase, partial [Patescibacteria group bacterium]
EFLGRVPFLRALTSLAYGYRGPDISKTIDGIRYRTPVLLAAGFDYNAHLTQILPALGFGGVEVGSVTARRCEGNPKPRLTRLPQSKSIIVNKGLRNDGVDVIIKRLKAKKRVKDFVIGVSIARTNDEQSASLHGGIDDYYTSLKKLVVANIGDFYTINISCPNTFGGETFAKPELLEQLLTKLGEVTREKPVYVKMPINLPWEEFKKLLDIIVRHKLNGVVIGNLNKNYDDLDKRSEAPQTYCGGLSGKPCFAHSNELIRRTKAEYGNKLTVFGCGGVLSPEDAMTKFKAGADLLQMITGMIYEGPGLLRRISRAYARTRAG